MTFLGLKQRLKQYEGQTDFSRDRQWFQFFQWMQYLVPVLLSTADDILLGVDPVQLLVQRVVVDGANVPQVVDGQDDIRALLLVNHHAVDRCLLAEEQEGCGS